MDIVLTLLAAWTNPLDPIVVALHQVINWLHFVIPNYGWSLVALAALVKLVFWPLNTFQFKAMLKTQQLQPQIKALQARHKNDKEKLNAETMNLYKESGANPFAGCLPILFQMPILISLYYAIQTDSQMFASSTWLWIGSGLTKLAPAVFAPNLSQPDYLLLALYVASMYFSIRYTSPAMDEQQAQQQKMMAFLSPAMVGFFGYKYHWPSALVVYWLSFNVFTIAQQLFLIRRYHRNPTAGGPHPDDAAALAVTPIGAVPVPVPEPAATNGTAAARRKRRRSRR
ncbi:MAG: YidC/Oxa1 family membrane protein insertase [Candidatus Eremiobacteraeota bacterium]|nr:YidC/Oxa1 family membrane protein insertase [Candidatus Eremiobacteraeota bacterium]